MDHTDSSEQLSAESLRCPEVRGRSLQEQGMEHYPHTCLPLSLTLGNRSRLVSVELCLTIARKACSLLLGLLSPLSTLKLAQEQKLLKKTYPRQLSLWVQVFLILWEWATLGQHSSTAMVSICCFWQGAFFSSFHFFSSFLFQCSVLSLLHPFFLLLQHVLASFDPNPTLSLVPEAAMIDLMIDWLWILSSPFSGLWQKTCQK